MLVTTKKKIYLCEYGVVEEGAEVDVSEEIIEQFGEEVFDSIVKEGAEVDVSEEIIEQFGEEVFDSIVKEDAEPVENSKAKSKVKKEEETAE